MYASALVFSPARGITRGLFKQEEPIWIATKRAIEDDRNTCLQTLEGHSSWVDSVAFSHDSKQVASASYDRTVKIWDAATGECLQTLEGHSESVYSAAFSHDSKQAASASGERTVKIWDAATGQCLQTLEGHSESVISVVFSPDGKILASGSTNGTVRLWATSEPPPNEQDEQASTTETSNTLWSDQARSTNPSSLSYEAAADMEQVTESRSSMTFFNYKKPVIEHKPDKRDDDIQSVKSIPDDIESLVESNSGVGIYRQAAVNYIVKMFTGDWELLALYQEATQSMDEAKFVRNHQRLLKKFFLDLRSEGHSPSQTLAVGFLRARSKRIHISSGIRNLVMPSDNTVREKINIMLKQEKDNLFLLNRLLDERDSAAQPTPTNTAEEISDCKPGIQLPVSDNADTASEESEDSDDDDDRSSDEPEAEIQEDNALSKLEATAEFLTSGRPFSLYKENLRGFLYPAPKAANMQENLQLDVAQTSSEQSFSNHSESERSDVTKSWPLETQAGETTQLMHNEDSPTEELSRPPLQNLTSGLRNFAVPQLEVEEKSCNFLPSLPLLVDMVLQSLPLPESEPPIPEGKVRARWKCVGHPACHWIVNCLDPFHSLFPILGLAHTRSIRVTTNM